MTINSSNSSRSSNSNSNNNINSNTSNNINNTDNFVTIPNLLQASKKDLEFLTNFESYREWENTKLDSINSWIDRLNENPSKTETGDFDFNSLNIEYSSPFDPPPFSPSHNSSLEYINQIEEDLTYDSPVDTLNSNLPTTPQDQEHLTGASKFVDLDWFSNLCNSLSSQLNIETGELFGNIAEMLLSKISDDECQSKLLDLMGFNFIDESITLIQNRSSLISQLGAGDANDLEPSNFPQNPVQGKSVKQLYQNLLKNKNQQGPISFTTEGDKILMKNFKKEIKKSRANLSGQVDQLEEEQKMLLDKGYNFKNNSHFKKLKNKIKENQQKGVLPDSGRFDVKEDYPHVFKSNDNTDNPMSMFGAKFLLPAGTIREDGEFYEELTIPIPQKAPIRSTEKLIQIKEMDSLCQGVFHAYKSLNRVQSIVYPIAYQTNENMLMCAPTGAGKTDVALLAILRTLYQHCTPAPTSDNRSELRIDKNAFKIVYVAPMKALAAEVVQKYQSRLKWLGIQVKELTGDMQLTRAEIAKTQIIVTTPEKWDVVTRKGTGDTDLVSKLKLLIIDEVHLLHEDRGSVIESIVARTLRQVESSQSMIRIVGLSATLPNYIDVANFLKVNPYQGLFYFDGGFRPVPLEQHFLGVRGKPQSNASKLNLDRACYDKCSALIEQDHQVMVFVHSRKDTVRSARSLIAQAGEDGVGDMFAPKSDEEIIAHSKFALEVGKSRNAELKELYNKGMGIHHAGMLRSDRTLTERMFAAGAIKVLCCTATLAWGVNLPAYAVIIKGTQVYSSEKGTFIDLSILDVLQIFGRAGRPQYETHGVGYILTTHDRLSHFISAITMQHPIESSFIGNLVDNLCAEICLGTVTNVDEAVAWLGYTYLYIRMRKNPTSYGVDYQEAQLDPLLGKRRRDLIVNAAKALRENKMISFHELTGYMSPEDLGRIASTFYLSSNSVHIMNSRMKPKMTEADVLAMVSHSKEFEQIKIREEESKELTILLRNYSACEIQGGVNTPADKVNVLIQAYISKAEPQNFSLVSDSYYVSQNAGRIFRAVFEIALNRNWGPTASVLLSLCKSIEKRMWSFQHPLAQFELPENLRMKLEDLTEEFTIEQLATMSANELGDMVRFMRMGPTLLKCVQQFPKVDLDVELFPITRNVLRMQVTIYPDFVWNEKVHGTGEPFLLLVEDMDNIELYHSEQIFITKNYIGDEIKVMFTIPIPEPLPPQIFIRAVSDRWIGAEALFPVSFHNLVLPESVSQHTDLLKLDPLPITALHDPVLEEIYSRKFTHFNPIQTQIFESLYHNDYNVLIGAPTGSGKTVAAELAMWQAFKQYPGSKVVYIAPLKALVKERIADWSSRLSDLTGKTVVELTGDITPDIRTIERADIIITTPEKWDGISRGWQSRKYVKKVSLMIIDEIHLLGGDRGPILEVIVSRMNFIASKTKGHVRIVGLSTALANALDLASWLGIDEKGLYNFRHSERFHYCPRMEVMNRPTYRAIRTHSPQKPVIVFVSSRRQTRLTARDLIKFAANESNPTQFLNMSEEDAEMLVERIEDASLKETILFGIGLHHAGLVESDRKIVEELFVNCKIQVLIATSTLAWGVNFPAHLVIVKGTEYFDAKTNSYVDYDITDILQMVGRAGRPQFDTSAVACVFTIDTKKQFFKKFLYEPFPVESRLHKCLDDHFNAEIAAGTITNKKEAMEYLTWTYLYQRLRMNPTYYAMENATPGAVKDYLSRLIDSSFRELIQSRCIEEGEFDGVIPTKLGKIASHYYLSHHSIRKFYNDLTAETDFESLLRVLANSEEYVEHPVRHNEDLYNQDLEGSIPYPVYPMSYDKPNAKVFLLLQAFLSHAELPIADYVTDTGTVLDQAIRILQSIADVTYYKSHLTTLLNVANCLQALKQAAWPTDSTLKQLPHVDDAIVTKLNTLNPPVLLLNKIGLSKDQVLDITKVLDLLPKLQVSLPPSQSIPQYQPNHHQSLNLTLTRNGKYYGVAHAPKFHKIQEEAWWIIVGDLKKDTILAMKRITIVPDKKSYNIKLEFLTPGQAGKYSYGLFIISDVYQGIDLQLSLDFCIV
ncbi:Sec63-domain-containing protein [Conidiobolus coronatus NRRL 28638]|uniref:Sec63-domain-containing protein n=1 Tax=Conidiobolus coronatus (strain ATCC 28846 / CBS 209.66 / NRRL 28638) TaxID=796925 RepID=A0A137PA03_CONC2|nr:Sec63-domain-containing protein [Conidiobolus coronatus NRRL 28638]|eukprot:KXN71829.1 Sec63-domain-containing protein [Conidiobolus coronatus NRRL 28638]